ncbi:hypothetical protein BCR44DRAFT_78036 [Catenaria anguillulae PL171]|uniref:Uncharacterized protein n=1 Tax=Catenaria anguillulae PL171 TaxID=765915 RepID=A0A1Y2H584_9FUNG|nr:hypothetical protein BCR44DRAFT_78036 [Catenaria anguillulae PL171]
MMTAAAPPDTHTLILLQLEPNAPSSRTYLEHPSTSAAILDLISMFEHKLRQDQTSSSSTSTSSTLKYTDMDVTSYIDSFPEIACLIRNPLPGGVSAYVPKDKEWIKQFVRPVLLQKLQSMRAAEAASLAGAGAESVSTLASRMSMTSSSNNVPAHQAQNQNQQSQKRQSQRNPRKSLSPLPRAASSSKSSNKTANAAKKQQQPTSKILVASASKPGKITKRLGPDGATAAQLSTQLFTKAYAEKKGLAHVAKPLPAVVIGASGPSTGGGAKRGGGGGGGGGGGSASGKRGGGGRR